MRAMVASLVVFLPGAALTTAVLELAAGQMVSGSSRLVSGTVQLALLSFGILAGIEAVGIPSSRVLFGREELLGAWAPWLGVLVFAAGVTVAHSAPARSFPGLLVVLYAAWTAQVLGNAVFGGYVSALVGATVMTVVAVFVSRFPAAMPSHASFLPGFWLLGPGRPRVDRPHGARWRGRRSRPRGHGRLDLRSGARRALRYAAHRVGRRDRPGRDRRVGQSFRTARVAEAPTSESRPTRFVDWRRGPGRLMIRPALAQARRVQVTMFGGSSDSVVCNHPIMGGHQPPGSSVPLVLRPRSEPVSARVPLRRGPTHWMTGRRSYQRMCSKGSSR